MSETPFVTALYQASQRHHAAFYAPGHKHGQGISPVMVQLMEQQGFRADLPELPELDNLFAPEGAILDAQTLAAQTFGADYTWFLVNGTTCGIEAAILATCGPGDPILLPRNVHQSVISALILSGAVPIFIAPDYDPEWDMAHGVDPDAIATALDTFPDIKAIVIVSPTYYGTCSDVEAIARLAHAHHIPLIVDEAHGPHFGFHPDLPKSALAAGADVVIQSTHKVLSALSQASMLHLRYPNTSALDYPPLQSSPQDGQSITRSILSMHKAGPQDVREGTMGNARPQGTPKKPLVSPQRIRQALQLVQSTSPNALLLASLDAARDQMATQGYDLMQQTLDLAERARGELSQIPGLRVFDGRQSQSFPGLVDSDRTRLTVDIRGLGLTGFEVDDILHTQLGVTCELPTLSHLTFIISLGNTPTDIDCLIQGFQTLSTQHFPVLSPIAPESNSDALRSAPQPSEWAEYPLTLASPVSPAAPPPLPPRDAFFAASKRVAIAQAIHHISAELICPYPPGIPLIMPGETVSPDAVDALRRILASGGFISGCADPTLETLAIVDR